MDCTLRYILLQKLSEKLQLKSFYILLLHDGGYPIRGWLLFLFCKYTFHYFPFEAFCTHRMSHKI